MLSALLVECHSSNSLPSARSLQSLLLSEVRQSMELQWRVERAVTIPKEAADREWERLERGEGPGEVVQTLAEVANYLAGTELSAGRTYFEPGVVTRVSLFEKAQVKGELLCLGTNADMEVTVLPWRFGVSRVVSGLVKYITLGNMSRREDGLMQADIVDSEATLHCHSSPSSGLRRLAACQDSVVLDVFYTQQVQVPLHYHINESRNATAILAPSNVPLLRDKGYRGPPIRFP